MNILQYQSKIWATADLLRGSGIKEFRKTLINGVVIGEIKVL